MNTYNQAVANKTAELIGKGWTVEAATKRARKSARHLHPTHKAAMIRRIGAADTAQAMTGKFHSL